MTTGTSGADNMVGTGADDLLDGLAGDDIIDGGLGDDTLIGGAGNDSLTSGDGSDVFSYADQGFGFDTIQDFSHQDKIDLSALHVQSLEQLLPYMSDVSGNATISLMWNASSLPNEGMTILGKTLSQLDENDFIFDSSTKDRTQYGTGGRDVMFGAAGDDALHGKGGGDWMNGGDGNDRLSGDGGNDAYFTGAGNDVIGIDAHGFGLDTVADFTAGTDKIDLSALHVSSLAQLLPYMGDVAGDATINLMWNSASTFNEAIALTDVLTASLTAADFVFDTTTTALTVSGNTRNDVVFGAAGNDTVKGLGGDDFVNGGAGNDKLYGGTGNDGYFGNEGNDTAVIDTQGFGVDIFEDFTHGADKVDLSKLHVSSLSQLQPYLTDVSGSAVLSLMWNASSTSNEGMTFLGTAMASLASGDFVFDTTTNALSLIGTSGRDVMFGAKGNDTLNSVGGNDWLNGGDGNDHLAGGAGGDTYYGGAGADTFVFGGPDVTLATTDWVKDFSHSQTDLLDVSGVDANTPVSGDQAFSIVGSLTGAAQMVIVHVCGNEYRLDFSTDADASAEFSINVTSSTALVAGDMVL